MKEDSAKVTSLPANNSDALTELLKTGAQKMLAQAVEAEVANYIEQFKDSRDSNGQRLVVRNGHHPERTIQSGLGDIEIKQPKVNDRRVDLDGVRQRFKSSILPSYLRRTKSVEDLLPWLYLKGVSTGDFSEALSAILGKQAPGLSATTITRLKSVWEEDYKKWSVSSLAAKKYVYIWADGVHFNVRLQEDRMCILVIIGATEDGTKELIAVTDGYRESSMSWKDILLKLNDRGLKSPPKLAIGDGALGFWKALEEVYPETKWQRCWVHKTANILDKLPKSKQPEAKVDIHEIYNSETKAQAQLAFDRFLEVYSDKYPKAAQCLKKDRDKLLNFYDFPGKHWSHIRTTNPIESMFATVRLRTKRTKGCGSRIATLTMVHQLSLAAQKRWRKLNGSNLLADVINDRFIFVDGIKKERAA